MCVFVHGHMHECLRSSEEAADPLELEFQEIVSSPMWVLGTKLSALQEQEVLLISSTSFIIFEFLSNLVNIIIATIRFFFRQAGSGHKAHAALKLTITLLSQVMGSWVYAVMPA